MSSTTNAVDGCGLDHPVETWRKACVTAAKLGGAVLRQYQGKVTAREKKPRDLVTEADLASQREIETFLRQRFPTHRILGEESGLHEDDPLHRSSDEVRWLIDPLDGTTNFVHGFPSFCVSVAVERQGKIWAGAVYDPVLDECFHAGRGEGAWLNEMKLRTSGCESLGDAMVAAGFSPHLQPGSIEVRRFESLLYRCQAVRRLGSAALNLCYVALGRLDGYFAESVKAWDVAAGVLLIEMAGGVVSGVEGEVFSLDRPRVAAAATGALHREFVSTLREAGMRGT